MQDGTDATEPDAPAYAYKPSLMGAPWEFRLAPDAIEWHIGRYQGRTPYTRIARVRLSFRPVTMQTRRFVTEIWPVDGPRLLIASSSWKSILEQEGRDQAYGAFIRELHRRIAASGARVTFEAGSPAILYWLGLAVFVIVSLGLAALTVRALQAARLARGRHHRRHALPVRLAKRQLFSPQPSGQLSPGGVAGASRAARLASCPCSHAAGRTGAQSVLRRLSSVLRCGPPAPSTWHSAPRDRHWSRGNRCAPRAAAAGASS